MILSRIITLQFITPTIRGFITADVKSTEIKPNADKRKIDIPQLKIDITVTYDIRRITKGYKGSVFILSRTASSKNSGIIVEPVGVY